MAERIYLYDSTLRDGAQAQGIDFSVADKQAIASALDAFGIDYIEGGWPGANPTDDAFFGALPKTKTAKISAFGMTRRAGRSASNDPGLQDLLAVNTPTVCLVGKTWDWQVETALKVSTAENLRMISDSLAHVRANGREAVFDAEHFFDGYKANPAYAIEALKAAHEGGAQWLVLCDTNGGSMPSEVKRIVSAVKAAIPDANLGIHCHNDTEQAVANSLAAVEAGVRQIQGTLNGIGERCGNANLVTLIPTLALKDAYSTRFETAIDEERLVNLTRLSHAFDELLNRSPDHQMPYVGASAFATKAGIHASALLKDPRTYEHVQPESVGNFRKIMVSDQGGKANFINALKRRGIEVGKDDPKLDLLISIVKEREASGYAYEGADASFELLARRTLGTIPEFFGIDGFRVMIERRFDSLGRVKIVSEAVVKITIDGQTLMSVAEAEGPVNALDLALRKDFGKYQHEIDDLVLADFKVRILNGGTEAITRVLIESIDSSGVRWWTVGVSENIIDASFQALMDSVIYKLMKNRQLAGKIAAE